MTPDPRQPAAGALPALGPAVLDLDPQAEADRIGEWLLRQVGQGLRKRGVVVAVSGGIDSALCATLCARALGPQRVFGLLMPEQESNPESTARGLQLCQGLGIPHTTIDITDTLRALGCYAQRDAAVEMVFPGYGPGWTCRIGIDGGLSGGINFFWLEVSSERGELRRARLPHRAYLQLVAATNFKQRVRKTLEYFHADRLNHAVVGTPNRLEHDQGFFVKQGDGTADLKPIAHLYKTQVYAMARALGVPEAICQARPTTDTYTLAQGQDEFFFSLPHAQMDLALWARIHGREARELGEALGIGEARAQRVLADIDAKRAVAATLHGDGLIPPDAA